MLTALILILLVAGIVYAARRWPDVEARLFGVDQVDVPKSETAEPAGRASVASAADGPAKDATDTAGTAGTAESVKEHARNAGRVADRTVHRVTEMAGGLFKKKAITEEPTTEERDADSRKEPGKPVFSSDPVGGDRTDDDAGDETPTADGTDTGIGTDADEAPAEEPVSRKSAASAVHAPGERVTSVPARPSEPAYLDATRHQNGSFEQLSNEADQAWRDREYERCEEACLKILVQQPKNIKYMTRIGQVYQQLGQLDDAKEAFEAAKKLDPRNFFVLNRLSEVERLLSDKKGRTQLNKVLKK